MLNSRANLTLQKMVEANKQDIHRKRMETALLAANIPGAAIRGLQDEAQTISYMSDGVTALFGYTKGEIERSFQNHYRMIIHPEDREKVALSIRNQREQGSMTEVQYRAITKERQMIWVLDKREYVDYGTGESSFYGVLVDITNLKRAEEERRLVEERYRMVLEQTSDIVFEWDIATDAMTYSKNFLDTFGYVPYEEQGFFRYIRDSKSIHPEDFDAFISVVHKVMAGIPYHEGEFRIRKADGCYLWFRCRTTTQFDFARRPIKAVGIVMDITTEKERSQKLKERIERDSFTNLYNKASIQSHIEQYLQGEGAGGYHGFLIIDMDHFKDVNDRMGHQGGDTVLLGLAEAIPKLFRGSDLVGRIGGDEFAVFVQSVPNTDFLEQKAKQILDAIRGITLKEDPGYRISCSVGVSCYPQNGETFEATYRQADIALYDAKERGRNQFALYHPDMEERVRLRRGAADSFRTAIDTDAVPNRAQEL